MIAEVNLLTAPADFRNDLGGILSKIVSQGKIWANSLGKKAEFKVLSDEPELNAKYLNLIFEILLQLVKNAVDHSFEQTGHIEIRLKETDDGINLTLSDDGKGIDLYVIRAKAIEQQIDSFRHEFIRTGNTRFDISAGFFDRRKSYGNFRSRCRSR